MEVMRKYLKYIILGFVLGFIAPYITKFFLGSGYFVNELLRQIFYPGFLIIRPLSKLFGFGPPNQLIYISVGIGLIGAILSVVAILFVYLVRIFFKSVDRITSSFITVSGIKIILKSTLLVIILVASYPLFSRLIPILYYGTANPAISVHKVPVFEKNASGDAPLCSEFRPGDLRGELKKYRYCEVPSDCVFVRGPICNYTLGTPVNKNEVEAVGAIVSKCREDRPCGPIEVAGGDLRITCLNNQCAFNLGP